MIVQMSDRATQGRLGNQIFGFFFLKMLEAEIGCEIRFPTWTGNALFNLPQTGELVAPDESICFERLAKPEGFTLVHKSSREKGPAAEIDAIRDYAQKHINVLELAGYFQYHSSTLAKRHRLFLDTFQLNAQFEKRLDRSLATSGLAGRPIICVHVRRGDYLDYGRDHTLFWGASFNAIVKAVVELKQAGFKKFFVYLCSDDLEHCKRELEARKLACVTSRDLIGGRDEAAELMVDFLVMARSNALMIANSSLSFAAAMLNRNARVFLRPSPSEDRFTPFDPWNSHILLPRQN